MLANGSPPDDLEVYDRIGTGSNNRVYDGMYRGEDVAVRMPRGNSDTRRRADAIRECEWTVLASQLGVGPLVYHAWYERRSNPMGPAGLYMITERMDMDMYDALCECPEVIAEHGEEIASRLCKLLKRIADEGLIMYDLKLGNVLLNVPEDGSCPDVRLVDFGTEFCERDEKKEDGALAPAYSPVSSLLRRLTRDAKGDVDPDELASHVRFATMVVVMSANTTNHVSEMRRDLNLDDATRRKCEFLKPAARKLIDSMQGRSVSMVRELLRVPSVRDTLAHYNGRRNDGTRRTFRLACGGAP